MKCNRGIRTAFFLFAIAAASQHQAQADYYWYGTNSSTWSDSSNWSSAGVAPTGSSTTAKLYVANGTHSTLVYNGGSTTYYYAGRAIVIGYNGTGFQGIDASFSIAGGTLTSTAATMDCLCYGSQLAVRTGGVSINGGAYVNTTSGIEGIGGAGYLTVNSGSCIVKELAVENIVYSTGNNASLTVNLNGGLLAVNNFLQGSGAAFTLNFNGGTLQALTSSTTYMSGISNVYVLGKGAVIDTNGYNITIGNALLTSSSSAGGGLTKNGSGVLTLSSISTYTGVTTVNAGTLALASTASLATSGVYVASAGSTSSSFSNQPTFAKSLAANAAFTVATAISSDFGTSGTLSGVNGSSAATVAMSWRTRDASEISQLISDVLDVSGVATSVGSYTLTMSYDATTLASRGITENLSNIYIAYLDGDVWTKLVGDYVLNAEADTISVTTTQSITSAGMQFGVIPEPSTFVLLAAASLGFAARLSRRRIAQKTRFRV